MKVLILGGNGLVGSSLDRVLGESKKVQEVFASTRKDADLFSLEDTQSLINSFRPNVIINSAAKVGGINANNTQRMEFIIQNLKINMNVFQACIDNPEVKIVNLGSSCIYPLDAPNPIKEDYIMDGKLEPTNSPYAMAKLAAIEMGDALEKQFDSKIVNLMPTNLYGPNDNFSENESHVIPGLISRMHKAKLSQEPVFNIWGTGKPKREFLYVDDLAEAINFVIKNDVNTKLLNVGSNEEVTIKELSIIIKEALNFEGSLEFDETKPDGNPRKLLDSTKIFELGWKPLVSLTQGIERTYSWFNENIS